MEPVRVQLVWANPRADSLTATVAHDVRLELEKRGATVDELDLYRSGFDSVLYQADEPDWDNPQKQYSQEVHDHAVRTKAAAAVVFVFPIWWYSLPALLKGYIDRVWNYGLFYGGESQHGIAAARWIGLAGHSAEKLRKRNYDQMIDHHLNIGIADYCGVGDSQLQLLTNTLGDGVSDFSAHINQLRRTARNTVGDMLKALKD